jgi:hypothetical protein
MNGGQRKIYDDVKEFLKSNKANFDYIDTTDTKILHRINELEKPFLGNDIQEAKKAMDSLSVVIEEAIKKERNDTLSEALHKIARMQEQVGFTSLAIAEQEAILLPFRQIEEKTKEQKFIANLMQDRQRLEDMYTSQLNLLSTYLFKESNNPSEPKEHFINLRSVEKRIVFDKSQLQSESDVNEYLEKLKQVMMEQIEANRKIILK